MEKKLIYNARLITPERIIENGYVIYENGKITDLGKDINLSEYNGEKTDAKGRYLAPGFIDIHCHGGGGADFMDGTEEAYIAAAEIHAKHGTTTLIPTLTTSATEDFFNSFKIFNSLKSKEINGAKMPGIHMEGPYFSPKQAGAQDPRYLRAPQKEDYERIYNASEGAIMRWSVAPELDGAAELGAFLKKNGVLASIGHTDAVYDDVVKAYENGFNLLTHFYSGMSTIIRVGGYRKPGVIESGYIIEGMNVEVIADGHHLPKELLKMIYKSKGADRIALVTDSMRAAGMPEGEYILGKKDNGLLCVSEGGVAKLPDRSAFAGSICTADRLVRTMYLSAGASICDAVKMITATPARLIGMDNKKGTLASGKDADLVLFDENINIELTIVEGKTVYEA